jgi:hypothetical protein
VDFQKGTTRRASAAAKTQESGEFSVPEENARPGDASMPEVPPAGDPGVRPMPAVVPPKPLSPPTSATPTVPQAAPPMPSVAPKTGNTAPSNGRMAGATQQISAYASALGRWGRRQGSRRIGAAAVLVVAVGLLVWLLASTLGGPKPSEAASPGGAAAPSASASRGPLPLKDVSPLDFRVGDCLEDFDPDAPQSTVVGCATGHSAQLVAVRQYDAADAYPGRDALKQRARDACKATPLVAKSDDYDLGYKLAYPSSASWAKGDRRVDCYVVANTGNVFHESLLP